MSYHNKPSDDVPVTADILAKYDRPGPRYTSYPTVPEWDRAFGAKDYAQALEQAVEARDPLAVYVHIPFCRKRCSYCGCNTIVPDAHDWVADYLRRLECEMQLVSATLGRARQVKQIHLGGGTPTFLDTEQLGRIDAAIMRHFQVAFDCEKALEADPRVTTREQLAYLREMGFSRVSLGVQDLDWAVQEAIGRYQTEEETRQAYDSCRELGFDSINMDLVYGLPGQTADSFERTIEKVAGMRPDRLAVYSCAYLPARLPNQREMDASTMATGQAKYEIFALARRQLLESGYRAIGMDHFALPSDELARAMDEHRLHRNFMGYTVVPAEEMVGFGPSAIGKIGGAYAQNAKGLDEYSAHLDAGTFATASGCVLSEDDRVRHYVIHELMCNFYLDFAVFGRQFGREFGSYFAVELPKLAELAEEGFVHVTDTHLAILPLGRVFVRNIAMIFDAYLKRSEAHRGFSRTV